VKKAISKTPITIKKPKMAPIEKGRATTKTQQNLTIKGEEGVIAYKTPIRLAGDGYCG
jgi:hypothetical protein